MAHEKLGDAKEELERIAAMLKRKIAELDQRKVLLEAELRLVEEKLVRVKGKG